MTRIAMLTLTAICILLAGIAQANASGQRTAEDRIADLEARVEALESLIVHPYDVPIFPPPANSEYVGVDLGDVAAKDVIPVDPTATLDMVCAINDTYKTETETYPDLSTLRCVRYDRLQPFEYQPAAPVR